MDTPNNAWSIPAPDSESISTERERFVKIAEVGGLTAQISDAGNVMKRSAYRIKPTVRHGLTRLNVRLNRKKGSKSNV
jgi:hypothetical protein